MKLLKSYFFSISLVIANVANAQNIEICFDVKQQGAELSPNLMGIFFEEINHAGEGGLYAELIANRSFEDNRGSTDGWTANDGTLMKVVEKNMINEAQHHALNVRFSNNGYIENAGYWGIKVVKGETYKLKLWAKADDNINAKLTARLVGQDATTLGEVTLSAPITNEWEQYEAEIKAKKSDNKALFRIYSSSNANITFDIVSLFPPTFKNRENGMRRDLAQMLYDIHPMFVRFPGGCYVEGDYRGDATDNRYRWQTTIGPVEQRSGHLNQNWGYYVQDGMGFHEYLQLCEDLNAEALFVVNVGLGHNWLQDYQDLDEYVQEALDAVEYANGDITTRWGEERAKNGHPEPFNLKYIEIGNENYNFHMDSNRDQSEHYPERYYTFYKAFKEKYPDIVLVGNVESWGTDDPSWRNQYPVEMVDEHYYRNPAWFVNNYEKYDKYDRKGPEIYVGEYAVTQGFGKLGNLNAALGEAVFIQGMERNSDIVRMSSYAPIFVNENAQGWMPDMIRFNAHMAYGTPSYYVQKLFGNNQGKVNIKWTENNNVPQELGAENKERTQQIGLGTWSTQAVYSDIKVTDENGNIIYSLDNKDGMDWNEINGQWKMRNQQIMQNGMMENAVNVYTKKMPDNITYSLKAEKKGGNEGFLIIFDYQDDKNFSWLNIGGWDNSQHAIEQTVNGARAALVTKGVQQPVQNGRKYDIRIEKKGLNVKCFLDNTLIFDFKLPDGKYEKAVYTSAALDEQQNKIIVKLTNPNPTDANVHLSFKNATIKKAGLEILTSEKGTDENTTQQPDKVVPKNKKISVNTDGTINYNVPAFSLNIITLNYK